MQETPLKETVQENSPRPSPDVPARLDERKDEAANLWRPTHRTSETGMGEHLGGTVGSVLDAGREADEEEKSLCMSQTG